MPTELLTFQGNYTRNRLASQRIYRAGWRNGGQTNPWNRAYRWMSQAMSQRGLQTFGHPPVWAWPKSPALGGPPTFTTVDALLGGPECLAWMWIFEFCAPDHLCLCSSYNLWNRVLDAFLLGTISADTPHHLFNPPCYLRESPLEPDGVQFCLPFIDRNWIRVVRPLPVRPRLNNWDAPV